MDDKISAVVGKLQQRLGDDYEVRIVDVTKNNDTVKKGISVRKNGEKIGRIYYWNGEAFEAFLGDVESSPLPDIDFEMSLKKQKDNIVAILINAEANKERLKDMPHRMVEGLDLAVVYKIIFKKDSEGITSSDINNGMMAMLRVTEDELYTIAMKNTKEYYAPDIKSMTETLSDMMKESQDIVEDIPETLFILSNETRQFGAICMLYPEVLKKFCVEKMIDGVFVIPSSIHEVLLMIADKNKVDVGYIRQMIKEVNYENVSEVERLSDRQFFKIYEDSYMKHLSPTTSSNYMQMAYNKKNGFLEFLGDIQLSKLNVIHLQKYIDFLVDSGLSAKTVKNRIMCIHGVIDKAMQLHYINKSYNFVGDVIAPKIVKKQIQSYNEDEVKKLLELVDKEACDNVKLLIYLAVTTGMRRSEMNALTFDDINLNEKTINVNKARVYQHRGKCVVKETKTASSVRVIPITNTLCTLIKKARNDYYKKMFAKGEEFVDSKALFTDDCGNPLRSETLSNEYKEFLDAHSDEIRYLNLHALRHTFASLALKNNADIKSVQNILGHADASTTLNTYACAYEDKKRSVIEDMEAKWIKTS